MGEEKFRTLKIGRKILAGGLLRYTPAGESEH